jgi:hypothetical protein
LEIDMKLLNILAGIAALIGATCSAQASVYNFTFESVDYDVTGQITTSGNLITSISGQVTGLLNAPITGLQDQPNIYFSNDNLINPFSAQIVSNDGILFDAGGFFFNFYSVANGPTHQYYIATNQFGGDYYNDPLFNPGSSVLNITIAAVPELSTWIMMIVGFAGISLVGSARAARWRMSTGGMAAA